MTAAKLFSSNLLSQFGRKDLLHWKRREKGKQTPLVICVWGWMAMVLTGAVLGLLLAASGELLTESKTLEDRHRSVGHLLQLALPRALETKDLHLARTASTAETVRVRRESPTLETGLSFKS